MPDVQIVPQAADFEALAEQIGLGELDLAITYDLGLDATFERVPLRRVQPSAFFAQGDPLAGREAVRLADLEEDIVAAFRQDMADAVPIAEVVAVLKCVGAKKG